MTEPKQIFIDYLSSLKLKDIDQIERSFELYHTLLQDINQKINLISRKMPTDQYWTQHFLDSIRLLECMELSGKSILDFGSGGGLPGIPVKLAVGDCRMSLLDSISKKVIATREMIAALALTQCTAECSRIEDFAKGSLKTCYDLILCRAVSLETRYIYPLRKLLKPGGKVVFYKAQNLDDLKQVKHELIYENKDDVLGLRRLIIVNRDDLKDRA